MLDLVWICDHCGEENEALLDPAEGEGRDLVSDCAICCRPHRLLLEALGPGEWRLRAERC